MKKQGKIKREMVLLILVVLIVITTIIIVVVKNNKKDENITDKTNLEAQVNTDATPETNPSIAGTEYVQESNGVKVNTSSKLKEDKTIGIYTLTNINLQTTSTGTEITAIVKTTSTVKVSGKDVVINFYDKNGKLLSKMNAYMPQVKPGQEVTFKTETSADLTNAYNFEIVL